LQYFQDDTTWFLAQIRPNCAVIAERNLRRQQFQTFLPKHEETKRKSGRFISTVRPLFTGYIFVAFDTARGGWRSVNSTYGISKLVSFGDEPQQVPSELVLHLMQRCDEEGNLLPPRVLKPGDVVRLTGGPFADFVASVEKITPDQRVWVLLDLMGRPTRVAVQADTLQVV